MLDSSSNQHAIRCMCLRILKYIFTSRYSFIAALPQQVTCVCFTHLCLYLCITSLHVYPHNAFCSHMHCMAQCSPFCWWSCRFAGEILMTTLNPAATTPTTVNINPKPWTIFLPPLLFLLVCYNTTSTASETQTTTATSRTTATTKFAQTTMNPRSDGEQPPASTSLHAGPRAWDQLDLVA